MTILEELERFFNMAIDPVMDFFQKDYLYYGAGIMFLLLIVLLGWLSWNAVF